MLGLSCGKHLGCKAVCSSPFKQVFKTNYAPVKTVAFTLAEVLITLGIIGVVSAMTIPSLINKCQKVVWANQAKKEYAMWTQVFKSILADNDTTSLSETELWSKIQGSMVDSWSNPTTTNTAFWTELGKYVKISPSSHTIETDKYYTKEDRSSTASFDEDYPIFLSNGTKLVLYFIFKTPSRETDAQCSKIKALGGSMCSNIGNIMIDVNGNKGPNVFGRDVFFFYISDEGVLYPSGGKDYALNWESTNLASNSNYWKNIYNETKEQNDAKEGHNRTGQLMEEGWKMTY
jgi:type II secretory pathway pseudopilin PulG